MGVVPILQRKIKATSHYSINEDSVYCASNEDNAMLSDIILSNYCSQN